MTPLTLNETDAAAKIRAATDALNKIIRDAARYGVSVRVSGVQRQAIGWAETEIVEVTITKEL